MNKESYLSVNDSELILGAIIYQTEVYKYVFT